MLSEQLKSLRRGKITASEVHKIMGARAIDKNGQWSDGAMTYIYKCISRFLTTEDQPEISSRAIEWGNYHEKYAVEAFSSVFDKQVINFGVDQIHCEWNELPDYAGSTPDGLLIGESAGLEVKCPYDPENHTKYLRLKSADDLKDIKPEYYWQVQMNLLCTGRDKWYFVSYHPLFVEKTQLFCLVIERNEADIELLKERIKKAANLIETTLCEILN